MSISAVKPPLGSRIDWGHPLASGLVGCWLFNENGGGLVYDLASDNVGTFSANASTYPSWHTRPGIKMDRTSGGHIRLTGTTRRLPTAAPLTFMTVVYPYTFLNATAQSCISYSKGDVANHYYSVGFSNATALHLRPRWQVRDATNSLIIDGANFIETDIKGVITGVTYGAADHRCFYNGLEVATSTTSTAPVGINSFNMGVNKRSNAWTTDHADGVIEANFVWARALSPTEIRQAADNPYSFIIRRNAYVLSTVSGDVTVALDAQTLTVNQPSITVQTDTVIALDVVTVTASQPTLTVNVDNTIALNAQTLAVSQPALTVLKDCVLSLSVISVIVSAKLPSILLNALGHLIATEWGDGRIVYKFNGFSSTVIDSFIHTDINLIGVTFDGTNVIALGMGQVKVYKQLGFSSTISSSFDLTGPDYYGLTWDGANIYTGDPTSDIISKHDGFSDTVSSFISSPGTFVEGITHDRTNLLSADTVTDTVYRHAGFSSTISDSFVSADVSLSGLTWDGVNVMTSDDGSGEMYKYNGFSSTVVESFNFGGGLIAPDITWDQRLYQNVVVALGVQTLTVNQPALTVTVTGGVTVALGVQTLTVSTQSLSVITNSTIALGVISLTANILKAKAQPITFDYTNFSTATGTTLTFSHTLTGQQNRIVLVGVSNEFGTISGVTYNGVAMSVATSLTAGGRNSYIYYLLDISLPVAGTYTVSVGISSAGNGTVAGASSYYNVKQQAAEATQTEANDAVTSISTDITTLSDFALIFSGLYSAEAADPSVSGTSMNSRWATRVSGGSHAGGGAERITQAVAGTYTLSWNANTTADLRHVLTAFAPIEGQTNTTVSLDIIGLVVSQPALTVDTGGGNVTVALAVQTLAVNTQALSVSTGTTIGLAVQTVNVNQQTLSVSFDTTLSVNVIGVVVSQPTITISTDCVVSLATQTITVTNISPSISTSTTIELSTITINTNLQTLSVSVGTTLSLAVQTVTVNLQTLAVSTATTISLAVQTVTVNLQSLTVQAGGNVTVALDVQLLTVNVVSPAISLGNTISLASNNLTVTIPDLTVSIEESNAQDVQLLTVNLPALSVLTDTTVSLGVLSAIVSIPDATVQTGGNVTVALNVQTLTVNLNSLSVLTDDVISLGVLGLVASIPSLTILTETVVSLGVQTITINLISPTLVVGSVTIQLDVNSITVTLISPTLNLVRQVTVQPGAISLALNLLGLTVNTDIEQLILRILRVRFENCIALNSKIVENVSLRNRFDNNLDLNMKTNEYVDSKTRISSYVENRPSIIGSNYD